MTNKMKRQNATKRTAISFTIALLTAITALSIQQMKKEEQINTDKKLEAKVYPKNKAILEK